MSQTGQAINFKPIKTSSLWLPLLFVISTSGLLAMIIFGLLAYQVLFLDRIYPGVVVDGQAAAGLSPAEVARRVAGHSSVPLTQPITLQAGEKSWTFTAQELGLRVDAAATADAAYTVGRQGNLWIDMLTHLSLLANPRHVEPIIAYDTGPLNQALSRLTKEINYLPQDAQLIIQPNGTVELIKAQRGRRLHPEATLAALEAALHGRPSEPVQAVVQEVLPALSESDLEPVRRQAELLLSQPLLLGFKTETGTTAWRLEPDTLVALLELVETTGADGRPQFKLEFNQARVSPYLEEFAQTINVEPVDARLEFDAEANRLIVRQPSQPGRKLDIEAAYAQLSALPETMVETASHYLELPVVTIAPTISSDDLASLGIKELISESTSYFKGSSPGRMRNIALAASKFDGVIVPPGRIFSFNRHLGEVTLEQGFDESLIIYGDRTMVGVGGGVCQVSTTVFRAAFAGGFELVERWAHGYRVSWYETNSGPGLDATVYSPDIDFRFRNDTEHYLLIQTETDLDAGTVTFRFYGTNPGREVSLSEPEITNIVKHGPPIYEEDASLPKGVTKQVDWAIDGMEVTITRTVTAGDVVLRRDILQSRYKPWRAIYKVGTGAAEVTDLQD